jgi:hypothetical protein
MSARLKTKEVCSTAPRMTVTLKMPHSKKKRERWRSVPSLDLEGLNEF